MDIEGGEVQFFNEYQNIISSFDIIIVEMHSFIVGLENIDKTVSILKNNGFFRVDKLGITEVWLKQDSM